MDTGAEKVDIEKYYQTAISGFTDALEQAILTSHAAAGIDAGLRRHWASVLFTRMCTTAVSTLWLCPRSNVNPRGLHWDFGAVASLIRNLFEAALVLFYIGVEAVSEDEWQARLRVMQLHDCMERWRMFRLIDPNDQQLPGFAQQAAELRDLLKGNPFFTQLPESFAGKLLNGERSCILIQDEILEHLKIVAPTNRGYYRFLSSHAHSFPLAYYRMAEHNRGRGEENEVEKGYIAGALEFGTEVLKRGTGDMRNAFADVVTFVPGRRFDWTVLTRRP